MDAIRAAIDYANREENHGSGYTLLIATTRGNARLYTVQGDGCLCLEGETDPVFLNPAHVVSVVVQF